MQTALPASVLRLLALCAAAASVAVASGCGGSDSSSESAAPAESTPATTEESTGSAKEEGTATAAQGKQLFSSAGCISCHTLADAGASGRIGPNLDEDQPSRDVVIDVVTNGDGRMPSFKDNLSTAEIEAVADYVSSVAGK